MISPLYFASITLAASACFSTATGKVLRGASLAEHEPVRSEEQSDEGTIFCHLFPQHILIDEDDNDVSTSTKVFTKEVHSYHCMLDRDDDPEGKMRSISLPAEFEQQHEDYLHMSPVLKITRATVREHTIDLSDNSSVSIHQDVSPHRQLAPKSGAPNVLAIYVTDSNNQAPKSSLVDIKNGIMGTGPSPTYTLMNQFRDCSYGQLNMQPATAGNNVNGGVLELRLNFPINSTTCNLDTGCRTTLADAAAAVLGTTIFDSRYDFVMWCLPDGASAYGVTNWAAFAAVGGKQSWFQRNNCFSLTTVGHELGHNMGFGQ
jgi:Gametolysin peptidase M11